MSHMRRAAIKAVKKLTDSRMLYGKLGKAIGSGQYEFEVSGKPSFVYVRIVQGGKQTLAEAINTTVSRVPDLPVMLDRSPSGDLYIVGADLRNLSTFQGDSNPNFDASPHSHR